MKRAFADRIYLLSLKLLAALNILFLVSFLAVLFLAAGRAHAEAPGCAGTDLLSELAKNDPVKLAAIRAEADRTPNGKGLLWKIEKNGTAPSYLFGTMHVTDPRVTHLSSAARRAFDASETVVIETTEVLDQAKMMAAITQNPELTMFTDGTTLTSLMSPQDADIVVKALETRGIPSVSVAKMKPWMLSAMVALPACELARKASGAPVLDVKLAEQAKASGKALEGLETVAGQLEAMALLPMDFHISGLVETLRLGDRIYDVIETMITLYLRGETGMFWPLFRAALPGEEADHSGYAAFEETMIDARNKVMAEHARPFLDRGKAFIAVGALHLPGSDGLVEILRRDGYRVGAVN
jgi:uncharacterized protein